MTIVRWPQVTASTAPDGGRCSSRPWPGSRPGSAELNPELPPAPTCSDCCRVPSGRTAGSWPNRQATRDLAPLQQLLGRAGWDADAVRDDLRAYVVERLGDSGRGADRGRDRLPEEGPGFGGRGAQYTGTAGRIENCQVGVFLAYATAPGRALIDRRPYLPEQSWCSNPGRRQAAGIPETVQFQTKPRLAWEMIAATLDAGVEAPWVTGDEAYGQDPQLRAALEARGAGYVMAVACSTRVRINSGRTTTRADTVAERLLVRSGQRAALAPGDAADIALAHHAGDALAVHPPSQTSQFGVDARDTVGVTGGDVQDGDLVRECVVGGPRGPDGRPRPRARRSRRSGRRAAPGTAGRSGSSPSPRG